jgi:hypothetical protein
MEGQATEKERCSAMNMGTVHVGDGKNDYTSNGHSNQTDFSCHVYWSCAVIIIIIIVVVIVLLLVL